MRSLFFAATAVALGAALTLGEELQVASGPYKTGDVVADFTLPALDGGEHNLSDRRGEGPVVLVFFRGVW